MVGLIVWIRGTKGVGNNSPWPFGSYVSFDFKLAGLARRVGVISIYEKREVHDKIILPSQ